MKNNNIRNALGIALCSILTLAVAFVVVDCCAGTPRFFECEVCGHHYEAPWSETSTTIHSDGRVYVSTIYHEEEFHVICAESGEGPANTFDCSTTRAMYYAVSNGQPVTVRTRLGKWTKGRYLPTIEPQGPGNGADLRQERGFQM